MIKRFSLFLCLLLFGFGVDLPGQQRSDDAEQGEEQGFETESWSQIRDRWIRSQPAIVVYTYEGKHLSGQPVHAGIDTLYLYASTALPVGSDWYGKLHKITFKEIDKVLVQKGGNRVTRSNRSVGYQIPKKDKYFTKGFQEVKRSAVYRDSLVHPRQMKEAFPHSPVMRQVFPHKHFRISVSVGMGGGSVDNDAREALLASPLTTPEGGYGSTASPDIIDISWRFLDRVIVGGQLVSRNFSTTLYAYSQAGLSSNSYHYDVNFYEHRLYAEYAFFNLDRYFTRRWELLVGAGFLRGSQVGTFTISMTTVPIRTTLFMKRRDMNRMGAFMEFNPGLLFITTFSQDYHCGPDWRQTSISHGPSIRLQCLLVILLHPLFFRSIPSVFPV